MSGYEFDPKDKDGSLRDRFDCYCKEVIGRAAHNLVFKQAQYLILHFGGGEIDLSMMMHVETVAVMGKNITRSKSYVNLGLDVEDYYRIMGAEK